MFSPVNFIGEVDHLQPDVHQLLIRELILWGLLGNEGALLQVVVHHVHLNNLEKIERIVILNNNSSERTSDLARSYQVLAILRIRSWKPSKFIVILVSALSSVYCDVDLLGVVCGYSKQWWSDRRQVERAQYSPTEHAGSLP